MAELVIFTGSAGVGKSTVAKEWRSEDPANRRIVDEVESYGFGNTNEWLAEGYSVGAIIAVPRGTTVRHEVINGG